MIDMKTTYESTQAASSMYQSYLSDERETWDWEHLQSIMGTSVPTLTSIFPTFTHRIRGQDTLNLGNQVDWANLKISISNLKLFEGYHSPSFEPLTTTINLPQISFRNSEAVEDYLSKYPAIIDFLTDVWPELVIHFGRSVKVELEVMRYPDGSAPDDLVGWIQCFENNISEGLTKLEQFEQKVFDQQVERVGYSFNFNIEFK